MTINDHQLQKSVIATLTYSDHFHFPLTEQELHKRLISCSITTSRLTCQLNALVQQGYLVKTDIYYHLPGHEHLVLRRQNRAQISATKLRFIQSYLSRLAHVPGILAIYLTGSLAVNNAAQKDDLDLMIITQPHRLWLTRLLLTFYCELMGIRRRPKDRQSNNRLCLNLYLTPESYALPKNKRNLYTAYELIQSIPLYDPVRTYPNLLAANSWIKAYLPNYHFPLIHNSYPLIHNSYPLIRLLDSLAYNLQLLYMRNKMTSEYITKDSAFFHPDNPGSKILSKLHL